MSYNPIQKVLDQLNRKDQKNVNPRDEKMTLDKLAELLEVSKQTVISWKDDPDKMPLAKIMILCNISGMSMDAICADDEKKLQGPDLEPTYAQSAAPIQLTLENAEKMLTKLKSMELTRSILLFEKKRDKEVAELENIIHITRSCSRKPRICAVGPSDAGKSSLGNYLLQKDILPTSYSPLTSVITYIHDVADKPSYLQGQDDAVVFGRPKNSTKKALPFDTYKDEEGIEDYIVRKGDYRSIVQAFGTREGAYFDNDEFIIDTVHLFADCPFLKEADYIDVPGYGSGRDEDDVALTTQMYSSDIVFFLSQADSFLRGDDLAALANIMCVHSSQSSMGIHTMYILATHANAVGTPTKVETIMRNGMKRLVDTLTEKQLELIGIDRDDYSGLTSRCFGFDLNNAYFGEKLNDDIRALIPNLIKNRNRQLVQELNLVCDTRKEQFRKGKMNLDHMPIESSREKIDDRNQKEKASEKKRQITEKLKKSIRDYKKRSIEEMRKRHDSKVNVDYISKELEEKKVENRRDSINDFSNYLSNQLNDEFSAVLKDYSERFAKEVDESIQEYGNTWRTTDMEKIHIRFDDFNFTNAFAGGLVGVGVYGALAVWASVAAAGSNLGAYILIAKIVSVLTALGISTGGTASVIAAVAAIGGPVVLGIAISFISAIAVVAALSGTWRVRLAKRIVKAFQDEHVCEKYLDKISSYWDETEIAVDACMESLHNETVKEFENQIEMKQCLENNALKNGLEKLYEKLIAIYASLKIEEDGVS